MVKSLGSYIREVRTKLKLPLRRAAAALGISPAFLSDIERDRRKPGPELVAKMGEVLGIQPAELDALDPRFDPEVKKWLEERPEVAQTLRQLRNVEHPEELLRSLTRSPAAISGALTPIVIFESELRAIAVESVAWNTETGGDLFGSWEGLPIVYLATRAGPSAVRDQAHFKLDVAYLQRLSAALDQSWGLRYFGDWHSHHRLGLREPSGGDRKRIRRVATKNGFAAMAEFIVTFHEPIGQAAPDVTIDSYIYPGPSIEHPSLVSLIVVDGISPVREALIAAEELPEQQWDSWTAFPVERLVLHEPLPRLSSRDQKLTHVASRSTLELARQALEQVSGSHVEHHPAAFGYILVVPASPNNDEFVAFAISAQWPHSILEVHWIDRRQGTTHALDMDVTGLTALAKQRLVSVFTAVRQRSLGSTKGAIP
jgi:transcriptional regulator with XRE-family HTH domain